MSVCDHCVVRNRSFCAVLEPAELNVLQKIGSHRDLSHGQALTWEGEETVYVANLLEGVLKLTSSTADGREQIVGLLYPSEFVGRPFGKASGQTITALTDAKVCIFPRQAFEAFAKEHPALEHDLWQRTLIELDRAREWMLLLGQKNATERLASLLVEVAQKQAQFGCDTHADYANVVELPFRRQQMADILGLTIETISRKLTGMRSDNVIDLPDRQHIEIKNWSELNALAGAA